MVSQRSKAWTFAKDVFGHGKMQRFMEWNGRLEYPHTIHVWHIYLHEWLIFTVNVPYMDPIGIVNLKFDTNESRASRVSVIHVCNSSCWCCNLGGVESRRGSKTQWERSRTATKLTPASYYKYLWPILFDIFYPALQKKIRSVYHYCRKAKRR